MSSTSEVDVLVGSVAQRVAPGLLDGVAIGQGADAPIAGLFIAYYDGADARNWVCEGVLIPRRKADWCAEHGALGLLWDLNGPADLNVGLGYLDIYDVPDLAADGERLLDHANQEGPFAELPTRYYLTLAAELRRLSGVPFVATSYDSFMRPDARTQVLRQLSPTEGERWAARGWLPPDRLS